MRPPSLTLPTTSSLSSPFLGPVSMAAAAAARADAKKRGEAPKKQVDEHAGDPQEKKRRRFFQRAVPLEGRIRTYKIRMYPTPEQRVELERAFEAARDAWNYCNALVVDERVEPTLTNLRSRWYTTRRQERTATVARRFEEGAIEDLVAAYKSNMTRRKKNPKHTFHIKYKSRWHTKTETLKVERKDVVWRFEAKPRAEGGTPKGGHHAECLLFMGSNFEDVGGIRMRDRTAVIDAVVRNGKVLHAGGRIQWVKGTNAFYFIWPFPREVKVDPDPTFAAKRIVALDPGLAPFQEWYSPTSGEYGALLTTTRDSIKERCGRIDSLRSRIDGRMTHPGPTSRRRQQKHLPDKQRKLHRDTTRRLQRKVARESERLRNYVCEGHYNAAHFLCDRHDIVIAPILHSKRLVDKEKRCFGSKTARAMLTWGHRLFRQRLAYTAARYPGRHVFECNEPGTSKTCTLCGAWKDGLRLGDKVYHCDACGVAVDRQLAGARNNFFAAYGMASGVGWDGVGG